MSDLGILYLVGLPIGNSGDLTLRASRILSEAEVLIGESRSVLDSWAKRVESTAPQWILGKSNQKQEAQDAALEALGEGKSVALISDAGMPVWDDPGLELVQKAIDFGYQVVPVPGVSAALAALVVCGFPVSRWYYRGFLPREPKLREQALQELRSETMTTIILEAPHRLLPLLQTMSEMLPTDRQIALAWQLTTSEEEVLHGTSSELLNNVESNQWEKGEFVIVLSPLNMADQDSEV